MLFVSHNMAAISNLCPISIWLEKGGIQKIDDSTTLLNEYTQNHFHNLNENFIDLTDSTKYKGNGILKIGNIAINNLVSNSSYRSLEVTIQILNYKGLSGSLEIAGKITNNENNYLHYFGSKLKGKVYSLHRNNIEAKLVLLNVPLLPGDYFLSFELKFNSEIIYLTEEVVKIKITDYDFYNSGILTNNGLVLIQQEWQ